MVCLQQEGRWFVCLPCVLFANKERLGKFVTENTIIASAIHLCGTQSIALRRHRDDSTADSGSNKGAILNYSIKIWEHISMKLPKMQFTLVKPYRTK